MLYRHPNNGTKGRGGGVGVAFYTDDPNSNPSEDYSFSVKCCLKRTKTNKPEAGVGSFFKKAMELMSGELIIITVKQVDEAMTKIDKMFLPINKMFKV